MQITARNQGKPVQAICHITESGVSNVDTSDVVTLGVAYNTRNKTIYRNLSPILAKLEPNDTEYETIHDFSLDVKIIGDIKDLVFNLDDRYIYMTGEDGGIAGVPATLKPKKNATMHFSDCKVTYTNFSNIVVHSKKEYLFILLNSKG